MQQAVNLLSRTLEQQQPVSETGRDILQVSTDHASALNLLGRYEHGTLAIEGTSIKLITSLINRCNE